MDMQNVLDQKFSAAVIEPNFTSMYALLQRGYRRYSHDFTYENYPPLPAWGGTVSKSGIPNRRLLKFLPPTARNDNFREAYHYAERHQTYGATLHDGMQFVERHNPYLHRGEIVIIFPGLLRTNCTEQYVPLLIVSDTEKAWDEAPISVGLEPHWWIGAILH